MMIVAYHGGFERDMETGEPAESITGENQAYGMCAEVKGIDVLITGHQHRLLATQVHGVTVVQPGFNGQAIGKIRVDLVKEQERWMVVEKRAELPRPDTGTTTDTVVLASSRQMEERTQAWLDEPIGRVEGDMGMYDPTACRLAGILLSSLSIAFRWNMRKSTFHARHYSVKIPRGSERLLQDGISLRISYIRIRWSFFV